MPLAERLGPVSVGSEEVKRLFAVRRGLVEGRLPNALAVSINHKTHNRTAETVKVTVNLPASLVDDLRGRAEREGKSFTQALKEAVALELYAAEMQDQG